MSEFDAGCCEYEIVGAAGKRNHIVDLIFLELEGLNDVLNLELEEIDEEDFVVEGYNNFIKSDLYLLYL